MSSHIVRAVFDPRSEQLIAGIYRLESTDPPKPRRWPGPALLFRNCEMDGLTEDVRTAACDAGWIGQITESRTALDALEPNSDADFELCVGRYSVLPFYTETYADLVVQGYELANSPQQHRFCADINVWSSVLGDFTPATYPASYGWDRLPEGSYVLKGVTNSRKHKWNTHMFAPTKADVPAVFARLLDDSLIAPQGIVAREYIPLRKLGDSINGLAFTHEYRLFYWRGQFIAGGFYWSSFEDAENFREVPAGARELGDRIARKIARPRPEAPWARFYVLDVAETAAGEWILIEVNDGQMSGLSEIDPVEFYRALWQQASTDPRNLAARAQD